MANAAGESNGEVLRLDFDRRLMLHFRGPVVTSDAGLLAYRELDAALGLTTMAGDKLSDARTGKNGRHALIGLLRQSVFGRLAGYEDVNDAERLRHDPAMRWIVGGKASHGCAASPSQMGRFETKWLADEKNLAALADLSGQWIDMVHARRPPKGIVLDMDSSVSPTHGEQEKSVWNGHYDCTCYHPLFLFNQFGDLERSALRPGNVHSADGWDGVLKPVFMRYKKKVSRIYFRADAGFANPDVYEFLEAERIKYAIRLPANRILQERIGHLLTRPIGPKTKCGVPTQTSPIKPEAGRSRVGSSQRSNGTALSAAFMGPRSTSSTSKFSAPLARAMAMRRGSSAARVHLVTLFFKNRVCMR
jgi:Transposase DDE domain group 1